MDNCEHLVTNKCVLFYTTMTVVICYSHVRNLIHAYIRVETAKNKITTYFKKLDR